jgi:hypothetical protein
MVRPGCLPSRGPDRLYRPTVGGSFWREESQCVGAKNGVAALVHRICAGLLETLAGVAYAGGARGCGGSQPHTPGCKEVVLTA